jgi:hypothetical protein
VPTPAGEEPPETVTQVGLPLMLLVRNVVSLQHKWCVSMYNPACPCPICLESCYNRDRNVGEMASSDLPGR